MKKRFLIPMILMLVLSLCLSVVRAENPLGDMSLEDLQRLQELLNNEISNRQNKDGSNDDPVTGATDDSIAQPDEPAPQADEPAPQPEEPSEPITAIAARTGKSPLGVGEQSSASAWFDVKPESASRAGLQFSVSDAGVASVSEDGTLTGLKAGNFSLTAVDPVSGKKATAKITVIKKVEEVNINATSLHVFKGKTGSLSVTVLPADASNTKVAWDSEDPNIARVSPKGVITGVAAGDTWVFCRAQDGSYSVGAVHIYVDVPVKKITFSSREATLMINESVGLGFNVEPADATNSDLEWTSSNSRIADVDWRGNVTAKGIGSCTITAAAKDGSGVKNTATVYVEPETPIYVDFLHWQTRNYVKTGRFALDAVSNCVNRKVKSFSVEVKCYDYEGAAPHVSYHFFCRRSILPGKRRTTEMSTFAADGLTVASIVEVKILDVNFTDGTYYSIPLSLQKTVRFNLNKYY